MLCLLVLAVGRKFSLRNAYAQVMDERLDSIAPLISFTIRSFDLGKSQSAKDRKIATQAPVLVLLKS